MQQEPKTSAEFTSGYAVTETVYTQCGFGQLKQVVSDFLAGLNWYTSDEGDAWLRRTPIIKQWRKRHPKDSIHVTIYRSRLDAMNSGGVLIKLNHLRQQLQRRE